MGRKREEITKDAVLFTAHGARLSSFRNPLAIKQIDFSVINKTDTNFSVNVDGNVYYCHVGNPYYVNDRYAFIVDKALIDVAREELRVNVIAKLEEEKNKHLMILKYIEEDLSSI